jgi:hypothetical protein
MMDLCLVSNQWVLCDDRGVAYSSSACRGVRIWLMLTAVFDT